MEEATSLHLMTKEEFESSPAYLSILQYRKTEAADSVAYEPVRTQLIETYRQRAIELSKDDQSDAFELLHLSCQIGDKELQQLARDRIVIFMEEFSTDLSSIHYECSKHQDIVYVPLLPPQIEMYSDQDKELEQFIDCAFK